jgi:hypothetical protein
MTEPQLTRLAGGDPHCQRDDCPTVYATDRDTIAVQGDIIRRNTPEGEAVVEIPREVLREAVRALGW